MAIELTQHWTDGSGVTHAPGTVLDNLAPWEERALSNGNAGVVLQSPVRKPAKAPVTKGVGEPEKRSDAEEKAAIRARIIELNGEPPHPNAGLDKHRETLDALEAMTSGAPNQEPSATDEATDATASISGAAKGGQ